VGLFLQGKNEEAKAHFLEALQAHETAHNDQGAGQTRINLGHLHSAQTQYPEASGYFERAYTLGLKGKDLTILAVAKDGLGSIAYAQSRYPEAIQAFKESIQWATQAGDAKGQASAANNLANCHLELGHLEEAFKAYLQAAEAFERVGLPSDQALAYNNVAKVLSKQGMDAQAGQYLDRALKIHRTSGNRQGVGDTLLNLGVLAMKRRGFPEALAFLERARQSYQELNDPLGLSFVLQNLGAVHMERGTPVEAIPVLQEALSLRLAAGDAAAAVSTKVLLGDALLRSNRVEEAIPLSVAAQEEAHRLGVIDSEANASRNLATAYRLKGRIEDAMAQLERYFELKDQVLSAHSQQAIAEMQTRFETERKEREIKLLQQEKQIQVLQINRQKVLRNALVAISILLAFLALAIGSRFRLKQRSEALLREKNFALEAANRIIELERDKSEQLLLNVLPPAIAGRLKGDEATIVDRFSEATILFADIVGFTRFSQTIEAEALVNILNDIFSRFDALSERHGLEKIKTIGDCYMVVGGVPELSENHCQAVARMALGMLRVLAEFNESRHQNLSIRIGINTGAVVAGVIGKKKFIYDLWGDAVNTASRMESHGEPSRIQVTEAVEQKLRGLFRMEDRGEIEIKGKGPMRTYFLLEEIQPAAE
jgi:class 3 adenylate cyclase/uncharacterized protein HemY